MFFFFFSFEGRTPTHPTGHAPPISICRMPVKNSVNAKSHLNMHEGMKPAAVDETRPRPQLNFSFHFHFFPLFCWIISILFFSIYLMLFLEGSGERGWSKAVGVGINPCKIKNGVKCNLCHLKCCLYYHLTFSFFGQLEKSEIIGTY